MLDTAVRQHRYHSYAGPAGAAVAIRALRSPMQAPAPVAGNFRAWAVATLAAEVEHSSADFWAVVYRLKAADFFDRNDGVGGHEASFRFAHETCAFAALSWLSSLQVHESDKAGPWAVVRWAVWNAQQRSDWLARRRYLWAGFLRQCNRYMAARERGII